MDKLFSKITYNDEIKSFLEIIDAQSKNIVKTLLNDEKFEGVYLTW